MDKFNAAKAAEGRPVCTRNGTPAVFISNRNGLTLVMIDGYRRKYIRVHSDTGKINQDTESEYDLFMQ